MPATVQAVLAGRIDRLPLEEKQILESAAVIGKDVPLPLFQTITELSDGRDECRRCLKLPDTNIVCRIRRLAADAPNHLVGGPQGVCQYAVSRPVPAGSDSRLLHCASLFC